MPARSPGLSRTGPEVILKPTPNSLAMMLLKVVFPSPGGPWSKVWSSGSPRYLAASTNTRRLSTTPCWPLKSSKRSGLSAFSNSFSAVESGRCSLISKFSAINLICKYTKKRPHGKGNGAFSSSATLCEASSAGSCVHSLAAKRQGYRQLFVNNKESISVYQNDARKQSLEGTSCIFLLKIRQSKKIIWFLFCRKVD